MTNPLVSICLPNYNYAQYLRECISSCLSQSYEPLEIIITDNASTDNSREVIGSFSDPRVRFAENPANLGLVGNLNRALSLARGDIVKYICADDYLAADAIEKFVAAFADPRVDLVFSSARVIDGRGEYVYTHEPYAQSGRLPGAQEVVRSLMRGNHIGGPSSVAVRAEAFGRAGVFDEALCFYMDLEMWVRILLNGDAYFLSEPLVAVRQHEGSETSRVESANKSDADHLKFLNLCLRNEEINSLLSEAERAELRGHIERLSGAVPRARGPVLGKLRSKTPPYIKKALLPLYRRLTARGGGAGGDS
jgi:glycosyltransferase involved in cell wall biosynthesis